jgi:hypothetical protein
MLDEHLNIHTHIVHTPYGWNIRAHRLLMFNVVSSLLAPIRSRRWRSHFCCDLLASVNLNQISSCSTVLLRVDRAGL